MKKILQVLDACQAGGIETHVKELSLGLKKKGFDVSVLILDTQTQVVIEEVLLEEGVKCIKITPSVKNLYRFLKQESFDAIHTHGYKANILLRCIALLLGKKTVASFHSGGSDVLRTNIYNQIDYLSSLISRRVCVSEGIQRKIPWPSYKIHNFVEDRGLMEKASDDAVPTIAYVGRICYEKGADTFCKLPHYITHASFEMIGEGDMKAQLEEKYNDSICFKGVVNDMSKAWKEIDILCVTSRFEGCPLVVIEAMASGVLVVSFDVGDVSQMIEHKKSGYIIKNQQISAMADVINEYQGLSHEEKATLIQNAYKTFQQHYSTQSAINQFVSLYFE